MKLKLMWAVPTTLFALITCFFIVGNIDVFIWSESGRFFLVFVAIFVFVLTATSPLCNEEWK